MSLFEYQQSREIAGKYFDAYIMAACRVADYTNLYKLQKFWPDTVAEMKARYNAPGGCLEKDN